MNLSLPSPRWSSYAAVMFFMFLSGCASHMNVSSDGADSKLMLKGHDPVAYFTEGRHVQGKPDIRFEHDGVTYRFASTGNRDAFVQAPMKYAPQYGGFCANGIAYGIPWGGDPDTWGIIDGKLYIFGGSSSRDYFLMDQKRNLQLAEKYWNDEVKGSNAVVQRYWRLVNRVPHYRSGAELEAELKAKKAAAPKT